MECKRCGHIWIPRGRPPKQCPKCKQYYYDKPREWVHVAEYTKVEESIPEYTETKTQPKLVEDI